MLNPPQNQYQGASTFGGGVTHIPQAQPQQALPQQAAPQAQANRGNLMAQMAARRAAMQARRGQRQQGMFGGGGAWMNRMGGQPGGFPAQAGQANMFSSLPQMQQGALGQMGGAQPSAPRTNPLYSQQPMQQIAPQMPPQYGGGAPQQPVQQIAQQRPIAPTDAARQLSSLYGRR